MHCEYYSFKGLSFLHQAHILEFGLTVHEKFVPQDMRPLHKKLVDQFHLMKSSLGIQVQIRVCCSLIPKPFLVRLSFSFPFPRPEGISGLCASQPSPLHQRKPSSRKKLSAQYNESRGRSTCGVTPQVRDSFQGNTLFRWPPLDIVVTKSNN